MPRMKEGTTIIWSSWMATAHTCMYPKLIFAQNSKTSLSPSHYHNSGHLMYYKLPQGKLQLSSCVKHL